MRPRIHFVEHLPDLMTPQDYRDPLTPKKMRIRITITPAGVEILGDSVYASLLEEALANAGAKQLERMLCG